MHGVKALGLFPAQMFHLRGDDFQAVFLEAAVNPADQVFADGIGLDDGKGALDGHEILLIG